MQTPELIDSVLEFLRFKWELENIFDYLSLFYFSHLNVPVEALHLPSTSVEVCSTVQVFQGGKTRHWTKAQLSRGSGSGKPWLLRCCNCNTAALPTAGDQTPKTAERLFETAESCQPGKLTKSAISSHKALTPIWL